MQEAWDRGFEAGCTDHLTKPIKKATLLEAIARHAASAPANHRIHISVESWLKPVVGGYLEKRRGDIAKLRAALDGGDYAVIRTLGHQMAGSGGGYGFEPITENGRRTRRIRSGLQHRSGASGNRGTGSLSE